MNRNLIIALGAVLLLGVGAFFVFAGGDADDVASTVNEIETSEINDVTGSPDPLDFDALQPTTQLAFVATISTTVDGETVGGELSYDGTGSWSYKINTAEGVGEFRVVDGDFYTYNAEDGTWFSFGTSESTGSNFDYSTYEYDQEELDKFKNLATYEGKKPCPAGLCDTWRAESYDDLADFTMAFDSRGRISKVTGVNPEGETSIEYSYQNVSIKVPDNVQTFDFLQ